jgi:hypothetical protein
VYYARFVGTLSAELGRTHLDRLEKALKRVPSLVYFADASALASCEARARLAVLLLRRVLHAATLTLNLE